MSKEICKCTRCKNIHSLNERVNKELKNSVFTKKVCPKCGAESYFKMPEKFIPFANATEYMTWQSKNCDKCSKYEIQSTKVEDASCELAFELDLASVSEGEIPFLIANQIGITRKKIVSKCRKFNKA
jgi:hypothetical protein